MITGSESRVEELPRAGGSLQKSIRRTLTDYTIGVCQMQAVSYRAPTVTEIREARKKKYIIHMFTVYGDDSSDGKHKVVFVAAALIGKQEVWDSLEPSWKERTGGVQYHATDCLAGRGDYDGWSKEERYSLHNDLARLIIDFPIVGSAFAMDIASFAEIMHGVKRLEIFLHCFAHMVGGACAVVQGYNKIHENDQEKQRAKFVFDSDNDEVNAGQLYALLKKMKRWDELTADCEGSVEFAFPGDKPVGIQAADLWAYEVRKGFDNKLKGINKESYARKLLSPDYPRFVRNEHFRSNIIEAKERIDKMGGNSEFRRAYEQWLIKHRRQDTMTNNIAFMAYWDEQLRREK
jgi:hypothetical protein